MMGNMNLNVINYQYFHRQMIDKVGPKQGDVTYIEFWKDYLVLNNFGVNMTLYNLYDSCQSWCLMHVMRAHILKFDFVFRLQKYGKGKCLSFFMNSLDNHHNFPKSTEIFLSNHCYGPSSLRTHSRGLKIEAQFTIRSQSDRREREGERSVVTKVVHIEELQVVPGSFLPR